MNVRFFRQTWRFLLALLVIFSSSAGCERRGSSVETPPQDPPDPFPALRAFEAERRAATNFTTLAPSDAVLGADPYAIVALGDAQHFASILRGRDAVVVLDAALHEVERLPAPRSPTGLALSSDGKTLFVVGERDGYVARYTAQEHAPFLAAAGRYELPDVHTLRDVAVGPEGVLYVVDEDNGRLISLVPQPLAETAPETVLPAKRADLTLGGNPIRVARVGKFVITNCLLAHTLVVRDVNDDGTLRDAPETRITHDGPIWSFSAIPSGNGLLVLVGGVEDHPLDRRGGFFGFIDSFVYLYKVQEGKAERLSMTNVSELGVVTPKAVQLDEVQGQKRAFVTGYGGEKLVRFVFGEAEKPPTDVRVQATPGGARAFVRKNDGEFVVANPLLDAFVILREDGTTKKVVPVQDIPDEPEKRRTLRLGEAMFFTTLMAPNNSSEGAHSRFTCETCHFEGYVDGRIHHTGRGEVRVVTKPLLGLFNNRPHFSRALDPDMSSVAHNEFRVAGAGNDGVSPWFSLDPTQQPTLSVFEPPYGSSLEPLELRKALMTFLMAFSPRQNPFVERKTAFSDSEKEGARVFRDKCESCHQARTSTDDAPSRVSFDQWEKLVLSPSGPFVWAMNEYRKTGVEPYVHEKGARVPSLRRLYKKRPYLTSGAAKDVRGVLERAGFTSDGGFFHDHAPEGAKRLEKSEIDELEAFLHLL